MQRIDKATITTWNDLWKPEYEGRVMLMNDLRDVFTMSLLTLGYNMLVPVTLSIFAKLMKS